jgi:hypothetical protein
MGPATTSRYRRPVPPGSEGGAWTVGEPRAASIHPDETPAAVVGLSGTDHRSVAARAR